MAIKNPFVPQESDVNHLNRNAYDLSRMGLFTTEIGQLSPLLSMEVLPGDTVRIENSQINIQGMPTLYPLQTRLKVSASFYYGRNRTVHNQFEDYIWNTKDVEAPWLRLDSTRAKIMISTGSLGDMLGVPSTVGTDTSYSSNIFLDSIPKACGYLPNGDTSDAFGIISSLVSQHVYYDYLHNGSSVATTDTLFTIVFSSLVYTDPILSDTIVFSPSIINVDQSYDTAALVLLDKDLKFLKIVKRGFTCSSNVSVSFSDCDFSVDYDYSLGYHVALVYFGRSANGFLITNNLIATNDQRPKVTFLSDASFGTSRIHDATENSMISNNPFVGNSPVLKISAYKFRLYEQICNYYYRNDKNNPFILDGEVQYNQFIPTYEGGPDDNLYDFHYRNWELDRFTSCTQLPQFGEAPLVGLTYNPSKDSAKLSFQATTDGGSTNSYEVTVGLEDDKIVEIADFSKDIPSANLRKLEEQISYGISINDLRVTNSFQRFLENTLRRGLRYRNQLKSHFGVSVDYPDIDIPQYIGGFSGEFTVGRVESTADTDGAPLGDFTGKLFGQFQQQNTITKFIPEHGFIFCIFSISPIPQYPQSIDKSLLKNSYLDYYLPEFGKSLGHVPVHYSEVCPLQNLGAGESPNDVFGYQRAYYDYMQAFDEVHGDFRTNLKDFAMLRTFSERPELSEDFTTIRPEQVNDVFVTRNVASLNSSSKHFLGNYYFGIHVARCIPRVGTPSLE